jgi:hypothetical protein
MAEDHEHSGDEDDSFWGGPLPQPGSGWTCAASCFDGALSWEPRWTSIEKAVAALSLLDELHSHTPDWDTLLAGFHYLHVLRDPDLSWPPLHDFNDFLAIGDFFLPFEGSNDYGTGSLLYIVDAEPAVTAPLMTEFDALVRRLREYPPLQSYVRYM